MGTFICREMPDRSCTIAGTSFTSMRPPKRSETHDGSLRVRAVERHLGGAGGDQGERLIAVDLDGHEERRAVAECRGISATASSPPLI